MINIITHSSRIVNNENDRISLFFYSSFILIRPENAFDVGNTIILHKNK